MTDTVRIFWPLRQPPGIEETDFSYWFCRKVSRDLCVSGLARCTWTDYRDGEDVDLTTTSGHLVVVADPEIVLSPLAIARLQKTLTGNATVCVPVYNETRFPRQRAHLPQPYLDLTTYLEVSQRMARTAESPAFAVESLDPGCVAYDGSRLAAAEGRSVLPLAAGSSTPPVAGGAIVDPGALVHRFCDYFRAEREDLVRLVPKTSRRVLDVGCGEGGYGRSLRRARPDIHLTGVEHNTLLAESARPHYDKVIVGSIEETVIDERFDLINCGDTLEHLRNPWKMLHRFHELLEHSGHLVLSVPNVGHWTMIRQLLEGRFQYIPIGISCIGHLRWFTAASLTEALQEAGFRIESLQRESLPPTPEGEEFIRRILQAGLGDEIALKTNEFVVRAVKL